MLIAGTAAEIAFKSVAYLVARRAGVAIDELGSCHDHPRGAVAALQPVAFPESFLHRMEFAICGQAFNGLNFSAVCLHGEQGARLDGQAVEKNRARSAQRGFASDMRAG